MGNYFKTVAAATKEAFGAVADAAKVIGPATVEATKETVEKINDWSDKANAKMVEKGLHIQSSADVPWDDEAPRDLKKQYAYPLAMVALMKYTANCDEEVSDEEALVLKQTLKSLLDSPTIPNKVKDDLKQLSKHDDMTFKHVTAYLDNVEADKLAGLQESMQSVIEADGAISPEEALVMDKFQAYVATRTSAAAE